MIRELVGILAASAVFVFYGTCCAENAKYTIDELVVFALERSEKIKIPEEELFIAGLKTDKAFSVLLPKVSASASYTRYSKDRFAGSLMIQPESSTILGLKVSQSFSLGGAELNALKMAGEFRKKGLHELNSAKDGLAWAVSAACYEVLRAKKAAEISGANVQRLSKHREAATHRLKVGEVTKTAVLRAEAELSGAKAEMVRAENGLKLAKIILARLSGVEGEFELKEPAPAEQAAAPEGCPFEDTVCLKDKALSGRPELQAAKVQSDIAGLQQKITSASAWPIVGAEGVYAKMGSNPSSAATDRDSLYAGVTFAVPIFEGGLRQSEVKEAEAKQRQALSVIEDLKKEISVDVDQAVLDYATQKGILKASKDQSIFAADNYRAVSKQFEFGLATSLDVMDANNLLFAAERQTAEAEFGVQAAILKIRRAVGSLRP